MRPQTAIYLNARVKVFRAEIAAFRPGGKRQRAADSGCVSELKRRMAEVLLGYEIFGNGPAFEIASQDQLDLELPLLFCARLGIGTNQIVFAIRPDDFEQAPVRPVYVFKFYIQNRVDPVFTR